MTSIIALLLGGLGWAGLLTLGIRSGRQQPERAKTRAIPWAIALAGWSGLVIGAVGFFWGAGIGDESAGEIAALLFSVGCLGAAPLGGVVAWFVISRKARLSARGD